MRDKWKWIAVPPALALVLLLGPWRQPVAAETVDRQRGVEPPAAERVGEAPPLPGPWQIVSTGLGVCLLGVAVVMVLARLRGGRRRPGSVSLMHVRQSLRLSGKHALHVVQFDDRVLLVGASDGAGMQLLDGGRDPELVAAAEAAPDDEDDGAVLKDMVIPRPPRRAGRHATGLADFRTLLAKARTEA